MSGPDRNVDLEALARPANNGNVPPPRRRWLWLLLPIVLLAGFLAVFFDTARDLFTDPVPVTVLRPQAATDAGSSVGSVVFQTAGWIEPDPYPVRVTALADGVVKKMLVEESDTVKANDPVCELVPEDAALKVQTATAALARAEADAKLARVELANAKESFEAAIEVTETRDTAHADAEGRRAEREHRKAAAKEGEAAVRVAEHELATLLFLKKENAIGPWQVELAEAKRDEAKSRLEALRADAAKADADVEQSQARVRAADRDFELRLEERLRVDTAQAAVLKADAAVLEARAALATANLELERMVVKTPVGGTVLTRDAQPGSIVGPGAASSPVCQLYDPTRLRVRVDVPQSQVAGASVGQRAEVSCDVRRGKPYEGRVIRIIDSADIQKVTLEVQVRIVDPDGLLKPDMLCQVTGYRDAGSEPTTAATVAVRIPSRCLATPDSVWVVDASTGNAAKRRVKTGRRVGDDVIILDGLNLTDKVIDRGAAGLEEGARIKVEGQQ